MLFIYEESDMHSIWMKDMRFPIDIIWMDENFRVIHFEKNIEPVTFPKIFRPNSPARYVLETDIGFVDENKIGVGTVLDFSI
jgi:uncharacterized protein